MTAVLHAVFMALVLSGPAESQPSAITCDTGVRHIELPAVPTGQAPTVCISPGRTTVFSFDTNLVTGSVALKGADRFTTVELGPSTLKLLPSVKVAAGERLRLTVTFTDNAAPTSAAFTLVVQAAQAEPLVNVYRQVRSAESYEQELAETKVKVRQCHEENARLRVERSGPGGLVGLRASGLVDRKGISSRAITRSVTQAATNAFIVSEVAAFRSAIRVAVEVLLEIPENAPAWTLEGATLMHQGRKGGELKVVTLWSPEPGVLGGTVIVEAEAPAHATAGTFVLKLWDASGTRTVTISGITFP